jgi:hypothetical protein
LKKERKGNEGVGVRDWGGKNVIGSTFSDHEILFKLDFKGFPVFERGIVPEGDHQVRRRRF